MTVTLVRPQPNPNWTNPAPRIVNGVNYTPLAWDAGTNTGNPASNLVYIVQARPALTGSAPWRTIGVLPDLVCTVTSTNAQGYFRVLASNVVTHVSSHTQ